MSNVSTVKESISMKYPKINISENYSMFESKSSNIVEKGKVKSLKKFYENVPLSIIKENVKFYYNLNPSVKERIKTFEQLFAYNN